MDSTGENKCRARGAVPVAGLAAGLTYPAGFHAIAGPVIASRQPQETAREEPCH